MSSHNASQMASKRETSTSIILVLSTEQLTDGHKMLKVAQDGISEEPTSKYKLGFEGETKSSCETNKKHKSDKVPVFSHQLGGNYVNSVYQSEYAL